MCLCICACVPKCVEARGKHQVSSSIIFHLIFSDQGLSLNLECTILVMLADHEAQESSGLTSQHWNYRHES